MRLTRAKEAPDDGSVWEKSSKKRGLRGGLWDLNPRYARAAIRDWYYPSDRSNYTGFRVVCRLVARKRSR